MALYLAQRSRRSQDARGLVDGAAAARQTGDACGAVHFQMGDRRADRRKYRSGAIVELAVVGNRLAPDHDLELWRLARTDGGPDPMARRNLCSRSDACGAQAGLSHLRPHARAVAALSSGAQDRRTDARAGARPGRHRSHCADDDPAAGADHRRGFVADGRADVAVRLALCACDHDHGRGLHVLHLPRDRMADRNSPQDE